LVRISFPSGLDATQSDTLDDALADDLDDGLTLGINHYILRGYWFKIVMFTVSLHKINTDPNP